MKLILFDLDGTLLDTLQDLTDSVNFAMDELKLKRYASEQVRMMIGNGVAKLMERAVTQEHAELSDEALRLQRLYYNRHTDVHTVPYEGVTEMLLSLKQNGYINAVHTNKDEDYAARLCRKHFGNLIDYVCGTTDNITKPNPLKAERLLARLGIDKEYAIYCGDSDVDVVTARNLGVECISVTWGFRDSEFLTAHGAMHLASCPQQVVALAAQLCGK